MIDYGQQEHDRIETPNLVPIDDTLLFGRNAGTLEEVRDLLRLLVNTAIRQESPAPGFVYINTAPSRNDSPLSVRWRMQWLVFSSSAAGTLTFKIGTMSELVITLSASFLTGAIPFPRTIDAGIDLTMVASGGAALNFAYLVGYPESEVSHA